MRRAPINPKRCAPVAACVWVFAAIAPLTKAQFLESGGARAVALSQAISTLRGDGWSLQGNPGAAAGLEHPVLGAGVTQHYLLPELNRAHVVAGIPFKQWHMAGVALSSFGFATYRETTGALSYGALYKKRLALGARANWLNATIAGFGATNAVLLDVGAVVIVSKQIEVGVFAINANRARLAGEGAQPLATKYQAGMQYRPTEQVRLLVDAEQVLLRSLCWRFGLEYVPIQAVYIRLGAATAPAAVSGGIGFVYQGLNLDVAARYQTDLGVTPAFSLHYIFRRKRG